MSCEYWSMYQRWRASALGLPDFSKRPGPWQAVCGEIQGARKQERVDRNSACFRNARFVTMVHGAFEHGINPRHKHLSLMPRCPGGHVHSEGRHHISQSLLQHESITPASSLGVVRKVAGKDGTRGMDPTRPVFASGSRRFAGFSTPCGRCVQHHVGGVFCLDVLLPGQR